MRVTAPPTPLDTELEVVVMAPETVIEDAAVSVTAPALVPEPPLATEVVMAPVVIDPADVIVTGPPSICEPLLLIAPVRTEAPEVRLTAPGKEPDVWLLVIVPVAMAPADFKTTS